MHRRLTDSRRATIGSGQKLRFWARADLAQEGDSRRATTGSGLANRMRAFGRGADIAQAEHPDAKTLGNVCGAHPDASYWIWQSGAFETGGTGWYMYYM